MDLSGLVERASRSVVGVITRQLDLFQGDFGFGTAFAVDSGVFATAFHVVASAEEVALVTPEGDKARGQVIAADAAEDVALIYAELKAPPLPMGSALKLKVGQGVVAIGYPLALLDKPTATFGIVSAVGRTLRAGDRVFEFLIQTDAAINPGNSGGPLINMEGEAVGVNSAIIAGAQGLGFAVPIDIVKIMLEMIRKYGRYVRPALGIYVTALNKAVASIYGIPLDRGLLVVEVLPGSPAEDLGLERGDVILKVDGRAVTNVFELRLRVAEAVISQRRPVFEIWRRGRVLEL
ncbi:S1C family serine protease [Pyrobaculum aerophilum]|nr:trypsin-like peptidase domain-containing protein [Pyrobaculum aerophilum]MCX8135606.1 trypsin-like peptidase domain-containing protein [Pyrobaculum aerophilum]HII47298.1 trypsin-like serine protease [Pyrobaculum aerophilum]